jgi:hypothetical protein
MTQSTASFPLAPFGSCLATLPDTNGRIDVTADFQMATGVNVLAQSLVRRQTTPRGSVIQSPNDCLDIRAMLLSKGISRPDLAAESQAIRSELLRDQRVLGCSVAITLDTTTGNCTIVETINSSLGPFTLTLSLTPSTVSFIVKGQ